MRKLNPDGTLKGYEFQDGYDPEAPPVLTHIPIGEDLIDFPCSPLFVEHFAHQGLTVDYPSDYYLDKKSLQEVTNEVTYYTGRYTELPAIGRLERRLKAVELKVNEKGKGGGNRYNTYSL